MVRKQCGDFPRAFLRIQWSRRHAHIRPGARGGRLLEQNLEHVFRLKELADRDGVQLLVALLPDENQVNPRLWNWLARNSPSKNFDFELRQTFLRSPLRAKGSHVVDLLPTFRADLRCLFLNGTHWTAEDHLLAAHKLAPAILARVENNERRQGSPNRIQADPEEKESPSVSPIGFFAGSL